MSVRKVTKVFDSVLRQKARPVAEITDEERILVRDMIETMHATNGVGLAAPQVGISLRIFVCNPTQERGKDFVFINPTIAARSGSAKMEEGCLSVPDITAEVKRAARVTLQAKDLNGQSVKVETEDLLARIFQHEIDHLDGVLFIDRLGFFRRWKILKKLKHKKEGVILC